MWKGAPGYRLFAEAALAAYLTTASYKAIVLDFPVDVTALTGGLTAIGATVMLYAARGRVPRGLIWPLAYAMLALIPLLIAPALSGYGAAKAIQFYSISLLAAFATGLIVRTEASLARVLVFVAVPGVLLVGLSFGGLASTETGRLDIGSVSSISIGRALGMTALLALVYAHFTTRYRLVGALAVALVCLVAVLFVGNRQGVIGAVVGYLAVLAVLVRGGRVLTKSVGRGALAIVGGVVSIIVGLRFVPQYSLERLLGLLVISEDRSSTIRIESILIALREAAARPMGSGWGAFYDLGFLNEMKENISYPHNVFVEIFHELGLPVLILFLAWVALAVRRTYAEAQTTLRPARVALFALVVFNLFVSSVSGEASSEKVLWAVLVVAVTLPATAPAVVRAPRRAVRSRPTPQPAL